MMLNYRIMMGLVASSVCSGLSLGWAMPGMAQQVVLTPGGTMIQPLPTALPVGAVMMTSPVPGMDGPVDETPFVWVPVPGTGVERYEPGTDQEVITGPGMPVDPDILVGGVGGVRYGDILKANKLRSLDTSEKGTEMLQRVGRPDASATAILSPINAAPQDSAITSLGITTPISLNNFVSAVPQINSVIPTATIASPLPDSINSIASPKSPNPLLLPNLNTSSDSPLSSSRILPGFNQ